MRSEADGSSFSRVDAAFALVLDRAFYARGSHVQNTRARFNGLMPNGFNRDAKAVDEKHAGSALTLRSAHPNPPLEALVYVPCGQAV